MMKYEFYVIAFFALLGMAGCKQLDVNCYENDPRLYFYRSPSYDASQRDSIAQSFFLLPQEQDRDTVYITLETMGMSSDQPRPFSLVQTNVGEPNAAIAGKHYLALDSEEMKNNMMIPAGAVEYRMPLIVLRDPSLDTSKVRLKLDIAENKYFKPGIAENAHFWVTITATAEEPPTWESNYWIYIFGEWGAKKMWFIINYLGINDFSEEIDDSAYRDYLHALAEQKLQEYNADPVNEDAPLREMDGTLVTFEY